MSLLPAIHPPPGEGEQRARLEALIDRFNGRTVAVLGDLIADEFIYGQIERVSREAPVLILKYDSTEIVPGGAGNAANNVASLGGRARPVGTIGRDEAGRRLVKSLVAGVDRDGILRMNGHGTTTKTRILAGGVHSAKQQVVRIDRETSSPPSTAGARAFAARAVRVAASADAVIVSDYGSGLVTPELMAAVRSRLSRAPRRRRVPILLDSRHDLLRYHGFTTCTPNESEVEAMLGIRIDDDQRVLERAGRTILRRTAMRAVLITRGSKGMALFEPRRPTVHIPIFGSDEIADVTGAGDTVIATMALSLAAGASFFEASTLANYAGGIVVMKRGTATVSADELREAVRLDLK
jgi:rfaE bifunctional protein kinase chain/domain